MKEKKAIHQLQLLKQLSLSRNELQETKKRIKLDGLSTFRENFEHDSVGIFLTHQFLPIVTVFAIVVVISFSIFSPFAREEVSFFVHSSEIAMSQNQYSKAKQAVAYAQSTFSLVPSSHFVISQSLALANTQMEALKLHGEEGEYTMQQCLTLYQTYHTNLEQMETTLQKTPYTNENKEYITSLKAQLHTYDKEAEKRLHMYKNLL